MNNRVTFNKNFLFLFTTFFFFIAVILYNIEFPVFDEYQSIIHLLAGGYFSDVPVIDYHFLGYIGYDKIITYLSSYIGVFNWVAVFEMFLLLSAFIIYLWLLKEKIQIISKNIWFLHFSIFIGMLSFLDAYAVISYSRPALILCGLGVYGLLFNHNNSKVFYNVLFLLGMLLRPESGLGMSLFVGIAFLLYKFDLLFLLKKLRYVIVLLIIFVFVQGILIKYSDNFLIRIEPEVEYKFMQGYVKELNEKASSQDSIKYQLATNGFIFDPDVLTPEYLRSIQKNPSAHDIIKKVQFASDKVLYYLDFYSISVCLFLISIVLTIYFRKYDLLFKIILLSGLTVLIFVLLRMNSGLGHRHVQPFLVMYNLLLITYTGKLFRFGELKHPLIWSSCLIILIFFSFKYVNSTANWSEKLVANSKASEKRLSQIDQLYKGELIIVSITTLENLFSLRYTLLNRNKSENRFMIFEFYHFSMLPPYEKYMQRLLAKQYYKLDDVYRYFCDNKALYLSKARKLELTKDYLKLIYNMDVDFNIEAKQLFDSDTSIIITRLNKCS